MVNAQVNTNKNGGTGGWLNLRKDMDAKGLILQRIPNKTSLMASKIVDNDWLQTTYNGSRGYVMRKFIDIIEPTSDQRSSAAPPSQSADDSDRRFVEVIKRSTNVRTAPNGSYSIGHIHTGAKFIFSGWETAGGFRWAKILWGGANAAYRYIREDCLQDGGSVPNDPVSAAVLIASALAKSNVNASKANYTEHFLEIPVGESGGWCQRFICFLCKAAGIDSSLYPDFSQSYCSQGESFFTKRGLFRLPGGYEPSTGDWVYFKRKGAGFPHHVALTVEANGAFITIVEGNNSENTVGTRTIPWSNGQSHVYGFGMLTYKTEIHGR